MDYVFSARGTSGDRFTDNPGPTRYLEVPPEATDLVPSQKIGMRDWFDRVTAIGTTGTDPANGQPTGDVLIYVHGFNTETQVVLARHRSIRGRLEAMGYEGAVATFDWPSANVALNYLDDRHDAKKTALRLVTEGIRPFASYIRQPCEIGVHVLAHSMGALVLREAFDDADDIRTLQASGWSVGQIMLCGADISQASLGEVPTSESLYLHCVRLTNYSNPFDAVLGLSNAKRVGLSPRAGRKGLPVNAPRKAVNVNVGTYYDRHREEFAGIPNADHSFYFYSDVFLRDVLYTLKGEIDRFEIPTREAIDGSLFLKAQAP